MRGPFSEKANKIEAAPGNTRAKTEYFFLVYVFVHCGIRASRTEYSVARHYFLNLKDFKPTCFRPL